MDRFHKEVSGDSWVDPELEDMVYDEEYAVFGGRVTVCVLTLKNGFIVLGVAGCLNVEDFDLFVGRRRSRLCALRRVWELRAFWRGAFTL